MSLSQLESAITLLRNAADPASVTPDTEAGILDKIREILTDQENRIATLTNSLASIRGMIIPETSTRIAGATSDGTLAASLVPDYLQNKGQTPLDAFKSLWKAAVGNNKYEPETLGRDGSAGEWAQDGYSIPSQGTDLPFRLCGVRMSQVQALAIYHDRHVPGTGGVLPSYSSIGNLGVDSRPTDGAVSFDYLCTGRPGLQFYQLGRSGWNSVAAPTSLYRAFDGCTALTKIVGIIDCQNMTSNSALRNSFRRCTALSRLLIQNIPDAITQLDLSDCPEIISRSIKLPDGTTISSSLEYLRQHLNDFGRRTAPLEVKLHPSLSLGMQPDPEHLITYTH